VKKDLFRSALRISAVAYVAVSFIGGPAFAETADFRTDLFAEISGLPAVERAMFDEVNRVREESGLGTLVWDELLMTAARQHSDEMTRLYYFSHDSPTPGLKDVVDRVYSAGLSDISVAENLASENNVPPSEDPGEIGRELTELLLASEYHRDNIMDRRFTHTGIGCAVSEEGTLFCTQVFSKRTIKLKSARLEDDEAAARRVELTLATDDVVGVWLDETDTYIFEPEAGRVVVRLVFRKDDGERRVVLARRGVDEYGAMEGFFLGTFDPDDPINFGAGITEVDVLDEKHITNKSEFYVLEVEGEVLNGSGRLIFADGNGRFEVKLNGGGFKAKYPILAGSGIHEVYFVTGDETSHSLRVNSDLPIEEAFGQVPSPE
jgi:uncharacterized protein YkwD